MANDRIVLRKQDGSGAGVIYKTRKEADQFLKNNPDYAEESPEEFQAASTPQPKVKAVKPAENKAVNAPKADA